MKVYCAAFMCLQFGFVIFWQKDFGTKAAHKMLVKFGMLSVIMLSVIMQSVIMLRVIMLSVIMLSVIMLSVIMLSVIMLSVIMLSVKFYLLLR